MKRKALVLGTNYYNALSAIRCLGRAGIPLAVAEYDRSSYGLRSKYVDEVVITPYFQDDEHACLDALVDYAKKQSDKPVLIPTHDNYMLFVDRHQDVLRDYYLLTLPKPGLATQVIEKDGLHQLAQKYGMPVPQSFPFENYQLSSELLDRLTYPILVKPVDSPAFTAKFRKKAFLCRNQADLMKAAEQVRAANIPAILQELIEGDDESMLLFDAFVQQNGAIDHIFTGSKLRQWPINLGASCLMKQRYIPELIDLGTKFLQDIAWRGFAEIEFKQDQRTGKIYMIEINARITNFNACIEACGINVPLLSYQDLNGDPLTPERRIIDSDLGIGFKYAYENTRAKRAYLQSGQWSKSYLRKQESGIRFIPAIWQPSDPRPAMRFLYNKLSKKIFK
ncbi:MAG: carboxylate--amine ligase [Eubacteriales bacterium]|nr:carboxylate--amine ligase [Eubacteriales bacterium]